MSGTADFQRLLDACTLQASGRLPPDEARWLAHELIEHPQWQEHVAAAHEVAREVRDLLAQREPDAKSLPSFEEVMARLPSEPRPQESHRTSLLLSLVRWWRTPGALGLATAAFAALVIGLGVQTSRLEQAQLATSDAPVAYRSGTADRMAVLAIDFKPTSTIAQVNALLTLQGLKVVDGPDANDTYLVQVPRVHVDTLLVSLRAQDIVLSVSRVVSQP